MDPFIKFNEISHEISLLRSKREKVKEKIRILRSDGEFPHAGFPRLWKEAMAIKHEIYQLNCRLNDLDEMYDIRIPRG